VPRYKPAVEVQAGAAADATAAFRGRRNSPEWVRITAEWLAERRGESPDSIGAGLVAAYDASFRRQSRG
jgi:Tat protein secretion system quality control protein TatD with DNase activity